MADDKRFSKDVEVKQPRSHEQVEKQDANRLSGDYNQAKAGQDRPTSERVDSEQIKNKAPGMNGPKPPQPAYNAMTAQTHNKQMGQDHARVEAAMQRNAKVNAERQAAGHEQQAKQKQAGKEAEQKRAIGAPQNSQAEKTAKGLDQNAKADQGAAKQKSAEARALERNSSAKVARESSDRVKSKDEHERK